jgi:hypothetical protein
MTDNTNLDNLEIRVVKSSHTKTYLMYIAPDAANILKQYPRMEVAFNIVDNDEGEEVPAIGIVPETSISNGFALQNVNKNRLRGCCPKDILEIGAYTMSSIPVFDGGSDWYILERK